MAHKLHQRLLAHGHTSSMNDLNPSISSRSETASSATFDNPYSSSFSDLPISDVDRDVNKESSYSIMPNKDWPMEPASLSANLDRTESWFKVVWDYLMITLSVLLLVKLALVITAWRADRDLKGVAVDQAGQLTIVMTRINAQMVTIFTVVFVAIVSTCLQRYALFKAQQGATIAELEQLQGSISPLTTLKLIWMLKSVTLTSILLCVMWSFYYLGSQANTLEYCFEQSVPFQNLDAIVPLNTENGTHSIFLSPADSLPASQANRVGAEASAAEFHYAFTVEPGADAFGMALIPDLSTLPTSQTKTTDTDVVYEPDSSGWFDVSEQSRIFNLSAYSNMIGWPFQIVSAAASEVFIPSVHWLGDFTYSPSYLHVDCSLPTVQPNDAFPQTNSSEQVMNLRLLNASRDAPIDRHGYRQQSFEFWARPAAGLDIPLANTSMTVCNVSRMTVDVRANCQISGCHAHAVRWVDNTDISGATSFHTPFTNAHLARLFFDSFVQNYDMGSTYGFKPMILGSMAQFLQAPSEPVQHRESQSDAKIQAQLSQSFTLYFNTYFTASQMVLMAAHYDPSLFDKITFHGALYQPHYVISWAWISMDLVSCLILLGAAVLSLVLRRRTIAPDILNSVSSLVRDSPHSGLPDNATGLSGLQRTRLMSKVVVQLGDVSGHGEDVGRIALKRVGPEDGPVKTLNAWTTYH